MSKIKKRQDAVPVIRNFVAKHQYQRGGVHEKPYKSKRQKAKQQLKKAIRSQSAADFFCRLVAVVFPHSESFVIKLT